MIITVWRNPVLEIHYWRMVIVPDPVLGGWVILEILDCRYIGRVPNFSSQPWLEVCREPPVLEVHTWRTFIFPDHDGVILDIMDYHYMGFFFFAKFQPSSMIRIVSRTPFLRVHTWRTLVVPDQILGVVLEIMDFQAIWLFTCVLNLSPLAWLEMCQKKTSSNPYFVDIDGSWTCTWRIGLYHESSWYGFFICVPSFSFLAWLECRIGYSLTKYIMLIEQNEVIMKVSWR